MEMTLPEVQHQLLELFSSETILVGHSLESDLRALKVREMRERMLSINETLIALQLIHSCVVDTAIVFPHKLGLPHKRALKTLAKDILHKFIQNDIGEQPL